MSLPTTSHPERNLDVVLVANRGEIACRIIRSARALGLKSVAIYSDADQDAPHVDLADEAFHIGADAVTDSYLNLERVLEIARRSGAGLLHPGYGFFSENPALPERCQAEGIVWVGPSSEVIKLMGDKRAARLKVGARGVLCVPGYDGDDQSDARLINEATRIGVPLMVKASMGGGGKGMRLVTTLEALPAAIVGARREASAAFGDGGLILERAVIEPKHIEVQIFADQTGAIVHLGERECSLQRRHQKVIEEAPSPTLSSALRAQITQAAIEVARTVAYVGAGTVEFLLDASGAFYFLEMNTRIQVEHPVTEEIYGVDLVRWQLEVARGASLPYTQSELDARRSGHAIEARIYAEDPARGFLPQTGPILRWSPPTGAGVRVDSGVGAAVSASYDPMLAKVIASGSSRDIARRRLARALAELTLIGPRHNVAFLRQLLNEPEFISGAMHTRSIEQSVRPRLRPYPSVALQALAAITLSAPQVCSALKERDERDISDGWGSARRLAWPVELVFDLTGYETPRGADEAQDLAQDTAQSSAQSLAQDINTQPDTRMSWRVTQLAPRDFTAHLGTRSITARALSFDAERGLLSYVIAGRRHITPAHLELPCGEPPRLSLVDPLGHQFICRDETYSASPVHDEDAENTAEVVARAPMNGRVLEVCCAVGERVTRGATLMVIEAMKLEHQISAPITGVVRALYAVERAQVETRQPLIELATFTEESLKEPESTPSTHARPVHIQFDPEEER